MQPWINIFWVCQFFSDSSFCEDCLEITRSAKYSCVLKTAYRRKYIWKISAWALGFTTGLFLVWILSSSSGQKWFLDVWKAYMPIFSPQALSVRLSGSRDLGGGSYLIHASLLVEAHFSLTRTPEMKGALRKTVVPGLTATVAPSFWPSYHYSLSSG